MNRPAHPRPLISPNNARVKLAASLKQRKHRDRHDLVLVEGERVIRQAIDFGAVFRFFLVHPEGVRPEALEWLGRMDAEVLPVSSDSLRKACDTSTPQGVLGVAEALDEDQELLERSQWIIVADRLRDPGNLGAVMRIGAAAGVDGFITTRGTADCRHPRAIRASAGGYFALPHATGWEHDRLTLALRGAGWRIVAADAGAERDVFTFDWNGRIALVIGSEAHGPHPSFAGTERVGIPMPGGVESLNAAVAAGILVYQAWHRRS